MANTRAVMEGFFKDKHGELQETLSSFAELQKRVPFSEADRVGRNFIFPVSLTRSHGVTFNGVTTGTAFTLNAAISAEMQEASVAGTEIALRETVAYGVLAAAQKKGDMAFEKAMTTIVLGMKESMDYYLESLLLYGQTSIGAVQGRYTDSGTTQVFQITKASWSPGLVSQLENAILQISDDDWNPINRETTSVITCTAVDPDERTITVTGTEAELDTIVANDIVNFRGSLASTTPTWEVFAGLDKIVTNTGSLFSISASTYNMWKGNTYAVGSAKLTMGHLMSAIVKGVVRGLRGDVVALVSVYTWTDLMNDVAGLRRFAEDTKQGLSLGANSLKYYGPNGGTVEVIPHAMVKAGEAFVGPLSSLQRIGTTDTTFQIPGATGQNENMFTELADAAGAQLRCFTDQGLICLAPAKWVKLTGIVNASLPNASTET